MTDLGCSRFRLFALSCLALCDPMDCSLPGSSVHKIFQARILEWVAFSSSRRSSQPGDQIHISYISHQWQEDSLPLTLPGKPLMTDLWQAYLSSVIHFFRSLSCFIFGIVFKRKNHRNDHWNIYFCLLLHLDTPWFMMIRLNGSSALHTKQHTFSRNCILIFSWVNEMWCTEALSGCWAAAVSCSSQSPSLSNRKQPWYIYNCSECIHSFCFSLSSFSIQ